MTSVADRHVPIPKTEWHADFLTMLPTISKHAAMAFRHLNGRAIGRNAHAGNLRNTIGHLAMVPQQVRNVVVNFELRLVSRATHVAKVRIDGETGEPQHHRAI